MARWVAIDLETLPITPIDRTPRPICITWWRPDMPRAKISKDVWSTFCALIDRHDYIVGHNVAFDLACLGHRETIWRLYESDSVRDTMIRAQLIDIMLGRMQDEGWESYSLEALTGGDKKISPWRERFGDLEHVPLSEWPAEALHYATEDARLTGVWWQNHEHMIPPDEWLQVQAAFALMLIEERGIGVDRKRLAHAMDENDLAQAKLRGILQKNGIVRDNGSVCKQAIVDRLPDSAPRTGATKRFPQGQVKTDKDTLEAAKDPLLVKLVEFQRLAKQRTFLDQLYGFKRVHPSYRPLVATGRTSSFEPNIQQIPRKGGIRELFRADTVFTDCDYSQLELCTWAQTQIELFGRSRMADMINAGVNLHMALAKELNPRDPQSVYDVAKRNNFGRGGGMGDRKFVETCWKQARMAMTQVEAATQRQVMYRLFPEAKRYHNYMGALCEHNGGVATITQTWSKRPRGACYYSQACNTKFQGPAADGAKLALIRVQRKWGNAVLFMHDQIMVEGDCPELDAIMIEAMREITPDVTIRTSKEKTRRWRSK